MNSKQGSIIAIAAAFFVLFSAMWDPRISVVVGIVSLAGLGIYGLVHKNKRL
jgi:hypothetical protein